jgi:FkbM family methyltransferase
MDDMLKSVKTYYNAVRIAKKHVVNWQNLIISALLNLEGKFKSRAGGVISCDAKKLLRLLVGLENTWRDHGDTLGVIRFEDASLVIPGYFGRNLYIPWYADRQSPPSALLKEYPFDVSGEVVLDIGSYFGNMPLMWVYKGAKKVIAVEPVPEHFQYLMKNVAGLPVVCLNVSLAIQLPYIPQLVGSLSYGIKEVQNNNINNYSFLDVPTVSLNELLNSYKPNVIKIDCEGCEHYVLDEIVQLPRFGVKYLAVQFHSMANFRAYDSLEFVEKKLGKSTITRDKLKPSKSGVERRNITAYWSLKSC